MEGFFDLLALTKRLCYGFFRRKDYRCPRCTFPVIFEDEQCYNCGQLIDWCGERK